jgi:hypothetical protein
MPEQQTTAATTTDTAQAAATTDTTATTTNAEPQTAAATTTTAPVENVGDLPEWAQQKIAALNRENASARVNAKQAAATEAKQEYAQQIGKILGLVADDQTADPAKLTEQLTTTQAAAQQALLELAVYKAAAAAKADPAALLDSRAFLTKASGIDPTDTAALAAAISEATTSNPRFKVSQAAAVGGADLGAGGSGIARTYSRAQLTDNAFYQANKADILAAQREGRITS